MPLTGKSAIETKKMLDAIPAVILEKIPRSTANGYLSDLANEFGETCKFELQDC